MKNKILLSLVLIVIISVLIVLLNKNYSLEKNKNDNSIINIEKNETIKNRDNINGAIQPYPFITKEKEINDYMKVLSLFNKNANFIYKHFDKLPNSLQKLYVNNLDTEEFILGFLKGENFENEFDNKNVELGETIKLNRKYPYYIQWDKRWGYKKLGSETIAIAGCGPTSVAMYLSGLLNDETITPNKIAKLEEEAGYFTAYGTDWLFFEYIAKVYNLKYYQVYKDRFYIDQLINKGQAIIVSVKPGRFTTVGHIFLIVDIDKDGKYIINDPNSYGRSLKKWTYNEIQKDILGMWSYSK